MITILLRISFRNILRRRTTSFISVLGLAIGIAVVLLSGTYIINELQFDKFHRNYGQIVRLVNRTRNSAMIDKEFANTVLSISPFINEVCRLNIFPAQLSSDSNPVNIHNLAIADSGFFRIFSFPLIIGTTNDVLDGPNRVVISKSVSEKLFHGENPIGKLVRIDMKESCTVTGIMADSPANSSLQPEAVVSLYTKNMRWTGGDYWNNRGKFHIELYQYYLLLKNKNDTVSLNKTLHTSYSEKWADDMNPKLICQPFQDLHSNIGIEETGNIYHTNQRLLFLLISISLLILILSVVNSLNILLSGSLDECKRVSILKSNGANTSNVLTQNIFNISLVVVLSLLISIIITCFLFPWFSRLIDQKINISTLFTSPFLMSVLILGIFLISIIAIYPSIVFSRTSPIDLFREKSLRNIPFVFVTRLLLAIQYVIVIALLTSTFIIVNQTRFINKYDLGFDPRNLLYIDVHYSISEKTPYLKQEMLKIPDILQATASFGIPTRIFSSSNQMVNNKDLSYLEIDCDNDFFSTLGIKLKDGRYFNPGETGRACIVNETFWKETGYKDLSGATCRNIPIIGITHDFILEPLHNAIKPLAIFCSNQELTCLSLKISSKNIANTLADIRQLLKNKCPGVALSYSFYNEMIDQQYSKENRLVKTISISSVLAIILCCMGLISMIIYSTERRSKELSIRKINGAKTSDLIFLLTKEFIIWITVGFIVAFPVTYHILQGWLMNFAFRTEIKIWYFLQSGVLVVLITLLTVLSQCVIAALRNPVDSLRHE